MNRKTILQYIQRLSRREKPASDVVLAGRERLLAHMEKHPANGRADQARFAMAQPFAMSRISAMLASVLIALIGGVGLSLASDSAMPGDPLYFVKRVTEDVQLGVVPDLPSRVALRASFISRRLAEVETMLERGHFDTSSAALYSVLADSQMHLTETRHALEDPAFRQSPDARSIASAIEVSVRQQEQHLRRISGVAPPSLRPNLAAIALDFLATERHAVLADTGAPDVSDDGDSDAAGDQQEVSITQESHDAESVDAESIVVVEEGDAATVGGEDSGDNALTDSDTLASDAASENEETIANIDNELRIKAKTKLFDASANVDDVQYLVHSDANDSDLHDLERDEDRNAVIDLDQRFSKAKDLLRVAREEYSIQEYRSSLELSFDVLEVLTALEVDIATLIDDIQNAEAATAEEEMVDETPSVEDEEEVVSEEESSTP